MLILLYIINSDAVPKQNSCGIDFFSVFIFSSFFPADNPYSINKNAESLGETRNISQLHFQQIEWN